KTTKLNFILSDGNVFRCSLTDAFRCFHFIPSLILNNCIILIDYFLNQPATALTPFFKPAVAACPFSDIPSSAYAATTDTPTPAATPPDPGAPAPTAAAVPAPAANMLTTPRLASTATSSTVVVVDSPERLSPSMPSPVVIATARQPALL